MFESRWSNGFALGLTLGIAATLIIILFGQELYELATCIANSQHCPSANDDGQEPEWWYWTRRLVEAEDTLAQWIMAFFTIAATIILILTFKEANRTNKSAILAANAATEANEISRLVGKVQSRAYVHAEKINHGMNAVSKKDGSNFHVQIEIIAKNSGSTPAYNIEVLYDIGISSDEGLVEYNLLEQGQIMKSGLGFIPPGGIQKFRFTRVWQVDDVGSVLHFKGQYVRFIFAFRFLDEFDDLRDSSITSGTFQMLDGKGPVFIRDQQHY